MDARREVLKQGLMQLDDEDLLRLASWPREEILLDGGNYIEGKFCPLCVALQVPEYAPRDDAEACAMLALLGRAKYGAGFRFNQLRGTPGSFYRDDRAADLFAVLLEVVRKRGL